MIGCVTFFTHRLGLGLLAAHKLGVDCASAAGRHDRPLACPLRQQDGFAAACVIPSIGSRGVAGDAKRLAALSLEASAQLGQLILQNKYT